MADADPSAAAIGGLSLFSASGPTRATKRPRDAGSAAPGPGAKRLGGASETDAEASEASHLSEFRSLGLDAWVDEALGAVAIFNPTDVQRQAIPRVLAGDNLLASARTGSGKTAAFALPILHALSRDPYGVCAVVMEPSRELAVQVAEQFRAFGAPLGVRVEVIVGGLDAMKQARALRKRPHVIVATPGRLASLLRPGSDEAKAVRRVAFLVLDEADRLLEPSMARAMGEVLAALPAPDKRQTLLVSATAAGLPREAASLNAAGALPLLPEGPAARPLAIVECVSDERRTVASLRQEYVMTPSVAKMAVFEQLLLRYGPEPLEGTASGRALVELNEAQERERAAEERGDAARAAAMVKQGSVALTGAGKSARDIAAIEVDDEEVAADSDDELEASDDDSDDGSDSDAGDALVAGTEDEEGSEEDDEAVDDEAGDDGAGDDGAGDEEEDQEEPDAPSVPKTAAVSAASGMADEEPLLRAKACIVFCGTVRECQLVSESLRELGWLTDALHSAAGQQKRLAALAKFRSGLVPVLVATDVAARGLDIPEVGLVVNWDLPRVPEDYVHRVGRTARAQRGGRAVSFITERDVALLHACEEYAGCELTELPGMDLDAAHKRLNKVAKAVTVARLRMVESGVEDRVLEEHNRRREAQGHRDASS